MGQSIDEYTAQKEAEEKANRETNLQKEIQKQHSEMEIYQAQVHQLNKEIQKLKDSQALELDRQKEQYNTIITDLNIEKKKLQDKITDQNTEIIHLQEIEESIAPQFFDLKEEIVALKIDIPIKNEELKDDIQDIVDAVLRTRLSTHTDILNKTLTQMLTEIAKINTTQSDRIVSEISKINITEELKSHIDSMSQISDLSKFQENIINEISGDTELIMNCIINHAEKSIPISETMPEPKVEMPVVNEDKIQPESDGDLENETETEPELDSMTDNERNVYNALDKPKTIKEISEETGIIDRTTRRSIESLIEKEKIRSDEGYPKRFTKTK